MFKEISPEEKIRLSLRVFSTCAESISVMKSHQPKQPPIIEMFARHWWQR